MPAFSSIFDEKSGEVREILARVRCPSVQRLQDLLAASGGAPLGLSELAELLEIGRTREAVEQFEMLRSFVLERWRKPVGNRVRYVAPIYVSSFCIDTCAYCNFSAFRQAAVRRRLTPGDLGAEIEAVLERDARVVELVYATDPEFTTDLHVRYVGQLVQALGNEPGSGALLCTGHLSREAYAALKEAGLFGIVQWDETLDPRAYDRWHAASPHKRAFRERMDNHERAMAAGLEVATGALFGLADFRYDALMQIAKARHFVSEYGRGPFVFGAPRLKPIAGHELHPETEVPDRAYETILMVYRIAAPETGRWLQTRETFALNLRNLLDGDVYTYRCGEVRPGGYRDGDGDAPAVKDGQFGVNELEREFVERELAAQNFRIDYAWTGSRFQPARRLGIQRRARAGITTKAGASPGQSSRRRSS